ncbi:MAG TPA: hypothetical protein VFC05_05050 [Nitrososphaeraceae archaeon]|jgi:hypothetical protein|nr:hypothetical protein [Nitrososphaeraceae archaeon]
MIPYEFIYSFINSSLHLDKSIRWVGLTNREGLIINEKYREDLHPLLTEEENEEYASNAISRQKTRSKFEEKIGKLIYAFGKYEKLNRATIPINDNYFLLLSIDSEELNFDKIIMDKVLPLINETKEKFVSI